MLLCKQTMPSQSLLAGRTVVCYLFYYMALYHSQTQNNMGHDVKNPSSGFTKYKGADQPAHPRSLISAFIILFLEVIISKLATSEFSIF